MSADSTAPSGAVREARRALGIERLALEIHDASLPADPDDDLGRGTPASSAGLEVAAFARAAGFDALQLGPQGLPRDDDASPYMGALFSRNPLAISLARLADPDGEWGGLLPRARLAALASARPQGAERRVPHAAVLRAQRAALGAAFERFEKRLAAGDAGARGIEERLAAFASGASEWLDSDALYEALRGAYHGREWPEWEGPRAEIDRALGAAPPGEAASQARRRELASRHGPALRFYRFVQLVAHEQHDRFCDEAHRLGLDVFGDLQVGASPRDTWRQRGIFLEAYRLGAPPSRTNPDGQPWHYPVLDPARYLEPGAGAQRPGPALRFVAARVAKMFAEYDALRIDHPQGLVCPWVYRADVSDALRGVQQGARLFASPDLPDHPALADHAIARRSQLATDPAIPRFDDHWVTQLDDDQVDRYALLFDSVVDLARRRGRAESPLACEVLSTLPFPLERVLARHGLGRFRVTQKADPADPHDVYDAANAEPRDWIMFGNHDTPPLWLLLEQWRADGRIHGRARRAAELLTPEGGDREPLRARLAADPGMLAHAEIALLFASPARNVVVFFADLFGLEEVYNRPGTVGPENWSLRLAPDWREAYARRLRLDRALNVPLALWLALRSRPDTAPHGLLAALRDEAERVREGPPLP